MQCQQGRRASGQVGAEVVEGGSLFTQAEYMDWNRQALVLLGWSIARNLRPNLNTEYHMHASSDTCTATSYYMKL